MTSEKDEILEFNQYVKSDKMPYIIYTDIASLIKQMDGCTNNPVKSPTTRIGQHILCEYSMSTIWAFDSIENKDNLYRGKSCLKKFSTSLTEHAKNTIDFEKRKMLLLTKEEIKPYQDAKVCYICRKTILKNAKDKNYRKVRNHSHYTGKYRGASHSICYSKLNVPNAIPVSFHNSSNYDYHFIVKELANEFEGQFECLGETKEKYKTFFVPIKKQVPKIDTDGNENIELYPTKSSLLIV